MQPPSDDAEIWVVRRGESRSPTLWSHDACGAIVTGRDTDEETVDEVYTTEKSRLDPTMQDIMLNDPGISAYYGLGTSSETVQPIGPSQIPHR